MVPLLGDFNRKFDRANDVVREDIDDRDPVDLFKIPHRERLECKAFAPGKQTSIDYVIVNEDLWPNVITPAVPKLNITDPIISDHCPVFVDLNFDN